MHFELKILRREDGDLWDCSLSEFKYIPLPLTKRYLLLHEEYGDGIAEAFIIENERNKIYYPYLIRKIYDSNYYDITTPYGYGGPIFEIKDSKFIELFFKIMNNYFKKKNIISEFIRFTPHMANQTIYLTKNQGASLNSKNIIINLDKDIANINKKIRRSYLYNINKIFEHKKITFVIGSLTKYKHDFFNLYRKNMELKKVDGYLNFGIEYVDLLSKYLHSDIECGIVKDEFNEIISSALYLKSGNYFIDYFLAASSYEHKNKMGNHFLIYNMILWAKEHNYKKMQLGGGHESLYFFKNGFSKETDEYFTGKIIHNIKLYNNLQKKYNPLPLNNFFPSYRGM